MDSIFECVNFEESPKIKEGTLKSINESYRYDDIERKLDIFGSNLSKDVPVVLYLGERCEELWTGLQQTRVQLISVPLSTSVNSYVELYQLIREAARYAFDYATRSGVYFVGHGLGASFIGKLMSDRSLFGNKSRLERLQAAFLISGIYNIESEDSCDYTLNLLNGELNEMSPLYDNFDHLWEPGTRLYVFSAENDGQNLKSQSRQMFDRLAESCDQAEMHYEIKTKVNRCDILEQMFLPNNFLSRLIRYDIALSQTR